MVNPSSGQGRQLSILYIEDNPGDARLAEEAFSGAEVLGELHIVSTGEEALEYVHQRGEHSDARKPDFIFLDWHLPNTSGEEVLVELKSNENLKHIPVIVLTGTSSDAVIENAYTNFANACIPKPDGLEELMDMVRVTKEFWLETARLPNLKEGTQTGK